MKEKINTCFFDLGNTLNNDALLTDRAVRAMGNRLKERGYIDSPETFVKTYSSVHEKIRTPFYSHTFGETEFFRITFDELGIEGLSPDTALSMYRDFVIEHTVADNQVVESLDFLSSRGVRCAILSNERSARVQAYLDATGLRPRFDAVIVSETVGAEKPNPEIFHEALRQMNIPREDAGTALMFGDNSIADGACTQHGMVFVLVTGYRTRRWYFEQGEEYTPDYEIEYVTPEALFKLLDSINRSA